MAGPGDPAEDVGAFFGEYLRAWLRSIPALNPQEGLLTPALARYPLVRMQPALRAFWEAYARHRGRSTADLSPTLRRATRFAAARLLTAALEEAQTAVGRARERRQRGASEPRRAQAARRGGGAAARASRVLGGDVIDYREQVALALRVAAVASTTSYSWFGRRSRPLPAAVRSALPAGAARAYLVHELEGVLYRSFYSQGAPIPVTAHAPMPARARPSVRRCPLTCQHRRGRLAVRLASGRASSPWVSWWLTTGCWFARAPPIAGPGEPPGRRGRR